MATLTITIPDAQATRVLNSFCKAMNYQSKIEVDGVLVDNPESKIQYARRMLIDYVYQAIITQEQYEAVVLAQKTTDTVRDDVKIT